jgi:hypothetical protein
VLTDPDGAPAESGIPGPGGGGSGRLLVNPISGRRSARSVVLLLLGLAALGAASFSLVYFVVNACVVYHYISSGAKAALLTSVDSSVCRFGLWDGIEARLRRWSVDYSAATPFKLALFFHVAFL